MPANQRDFRRSADDTPLDNTNRKLLAELQDNLELIDHKIDVYRGRLQAGDADRLWAPSPDEG